MADPRAILEQTDRAIATHDVDAFMALVAEDAVFRGPGGPEGHELKGHAAIRALMEQMMAAYPNAEFEVVRRFVDGDTVISEVKSTMTHTGSLTLATGEKVEGTNRTVRGQELYIDHVVDGKIVEETAYYDRHALLQQLGQLPSPAATAP